MAVCHQRCAIVSDGRLIMLHRWPPIPHLHLFLPHQALVLLLQDRDMRHTVYGTRRVSKAKRVPLWEQRLALISSRCTVSVTTDPTWTISIEGEDELDQAALFEHLLQDESLGMSQVTPSPNEDEVMRRISRLEVLRRRLGFTLVLPKSAAASSQAVSTTQDRSDPTSDSFVDDVFTAERDDEGRDKKDDTDKKDISNWESPVLTDGSADSQA